MRTNDCAGMAQCPGRRERGIGPMGRRTAVNEVARAAVWLAIDTPEYITAERLHVAGGFDQD